MVVSGFVFEGQTSANSNEVLVYVAGGDYVELSGNEIRKAAMSGVFLSGADGVKIVGNWIHDNGTRWNLDHGIYWSSGTSGLIADNVIERNKAFGIQIYPYVDNLTVRANTISANGRGGVIIDGSVENHLIASNTITNNAEHGVRTGSGSAPGPGNTLRDNVMYGNPQGDIWDPFGVLIVQ